ncbi:protein-L-isoaspartate(D-aspartate) O-methyltransferase [Stackebrandtia albiflava]|uniref:Protein-L-isoaspartate O-methyltransferase n=1 Tax=Stackebrandtia albiflava TaxID=406432 RepID=A0A562V9Q2_9ACTN|nr:methyltransferase domain-containing protein [Stackebrandtia albiflava]TWJ14616.1 protein-L-isoaspartate(D-aspartate) O-methyltransferase [Stackebrandtia albiflava]
MSDETDDWRDHARRLARFLVAEGVLSDPEWTARFEAAPRHRFIPEGMVDVGGRLADTRTWDRETLLRHGYADQVVVTRFHSARGRRIATSSLSQPTIMAIMLELTRLADGHRVLEIGTGPGYNAYLLCARVGDHHVTSLDVQADLVQEAAERLAALDMFPAIVARDGWQGHPDRAPYDRVLATCSLPDIPVAWLDQLNPGARVVAPMTFGGALAVLDRTDDGTLTGGFDTEAGFFMPMRHVGQRWPTEDPEPPGEIVATDGDAPGAALFDPDFRLWLEVAVRATEVVPYRVPGDPTAGVRVEHGDDVVDVDLGSGEVRGAARLWRRVAAEHAAWEETGRPPRDRFGMTVTRHGQWVWLDGTGLRWPLVETPGGPPPPLSRDATGECDVVDQPGSATVARPTETSLRSAA